VKLLRRPIRPIALGVIAGTVAAIVAVPSPASPEARGTRGTEGTGTDPVIAAAGDIACPGDPCAAQRDTAHLIATLDPTAVLALGDDQYSSGALSDYDTSYDPTWGRFKGTTHPVPGNHEYETSGATGYFSYFGARAHGPGGYYSFDLGSWHLIALNSGRGSIGSRQLRWLRRDLAADDHLCELAYWHHPRWSSGTTHGSDADMGAAWRVLSGAGVDVVLNGHEHNYERFAKMNASGEPDPQGIREFVAGTGGRSLYGFGPAIRGSRVRIRSFGVLELVLHGRGYAWDFLGTDGASLDSGRTACHP